MREESEEPGRYPYLTKYKKSIITLLIFVTYAGAVFWGNYTSLQRLQSTTLTQFKLETEKQASAISYFFSERRSDISELAESESVGSFFSNRDLGMTYEYGLGVNIQVIEDRLERLAKRKRIGEQGIYSALALIDANGLLVASWNGPNDLDGFKSWVASDNHVTQIRLAAHNKELMVSSPVWVNQVYQGELIAWLRADTIFAQFGNSHLKGQSLLVERATGAPLNAVAAFSWSESYWQALEGQEGVVAQGVGDGHVLAKVDIAQTPLSFVSVAADNPLNDDSDRLFLIAAGVIPLIVVFLAFLDVMERRRLEYLREMARQEAERLAQARSDFLANMSHEIRTPMNAIIGMTELCLATDLNPKQRNYVAKIQRASDSLLRIINDILDFSKIESGKLGIEKVPFELDRVLDSLGELFSEKAGKKSIELVFDVDESDKRVFIGDSLRLEQVLINLVGNAIKFSEQGNIIVRVRTEVLDETSARLSFDVIDEGIGLSVEEQARLFNAFTQADTTTTRRYGGTGLGLAICKRLVGLMDGRIRVESLPGQGSNFSFFVCVGLDPAQETHLNSMAQQLTAQAHRPVLVVDDNPVSRSAIEMQLKLIGLQAESCASGNQALQAVAREGAPDYLAVLVDLMMPELAGVETVRQLKAFWVGKLVPPPIILMGGSSHDKGLESVSDLFESFMVKPTTATGLFTEISPFLTIRESVASSIGKSVVSAPRNLGREFRALKGVEVLLVDDVLLNQEVVRDMLESAGLRVRLVGNGLEALDAVAQQRPDCVIMDCQMPVMDGYEATRRLRQDERYRNLPIIALTANAMPSEAERCREAGMDAYITKPVRSGDLFAALAEHLPRPLVSSITAAVPEVQEPLPMLPGVDTQLGVHYANGKVALYRKLLNLFLDSHGRDFKTECPAAIASRDWKTAMRLAHSMKGAALMIGAAHLSELAKALEEACREERTEAIGARLDPVIQELEMVCAGLARLAP